MAGRRGVDFDVLFGELSPRVLRLGFQLTGDAALAEDVVQETFLAVHRGLGGFRGEAAVSTWVYRIAVHEARRVRAKAAKAGVVGGGVGAIAGDEDEGGIDAGALYRALDALPMEQREALCLLSVRGLSGVVAGEVLGVPEGTVYSRAHAARRRLRALLGEGAGGAG